MEVARRAWRPCSLRIALLTLFLVSPWSVLQVTPVTGMTPATPVSRTKLKKGWQVSNMGRRRDTRGNITPGYLHPDGYWRVNIRRRQFLLHRLVAHACLGAPPSQKKCIVNHIDHNRSNNRLDNLEWVTCKQNSRHSTRRATGKPVMVRSVESQEWITFLSIKEAAKHLGQHASTVRKRCQRNETIDGFEYRLVRLDEHTLPDLSGEEWRQMIDPRSGAELDGRKVSSYGRLSYKGRISVGSCHATGYVCTTMPINGKARWLSVHRLVAFAFFGPPPTRNHTQINHKDGCKSNNTVANLEYATPPENNRHHHANRKGCHPLSKPVLSRKCGSSDAWRHHPSLKSAGDTLGVHPNGISKCIRGGQKQTGGFEFRLAEPDDTTVETLPGEKWYDVDIEDHLKERRSRTKSLADVNRC